MTTRRRQGLTAGRIFLGFLLLLALVILSTIVSNINVRLIVRNNGQVEHSYQVLRTSDQAEAHLSAAESAARGYALAGREDFAAEFESEVIKTRQKLEELASLTADNVAQHGIALELRPLLDQRFDTLRGAIARRRAGDEVQLPAGKQTAALAVRSKISAILRQLRADEERLREARVIQTRKSVEWATGSFWLSSLIAVSALLGFYSLISKYIRAQDRVRQVELKRATELAEQVAQRTAELSAANRDLAAFSYSVSHDLKSPLRAIGGFARVLQAELRGSLSRENAQLLDRIVVNCHRMSELIEALLSLARLSRAELHLQAVDLSKLSTEVASELTSEEVSARVKLEIEQGLEVVGDERLLRVVMSNLLSNALKFTALAEIPTIKIGRRQTSDGLAIYVQDNGTGFDQSRAEKLFEPFQRLHSEKDFPGTGIGLATCENIVRRHGGRIWAESAPGEGATILFTLPGSPAAMQTKAASPSAYMSPDLPRT